MKFTLGAMSIQAFMAATRPQVAPAMAPIAEQSFHMRATVTGATAEQMKVY